jgi:hypothetical protein
MAAPTRRPEGMPPGLHAAVDERRQLLCQPRRGGKPRETVRDAPAHAWPTGCIVHGAPPALGAPGCGDPLFYARAREEACVWAPDYHYPELLPHGVPCAECGRSGATERQGIMAPRFVQPNLWLYTARCVAERAAAHRA